MLAILFTPSTKAQTKINPNQIGPGTVSSAITFKATIQAQTLVSRDCRVDGTIDTTGAVDAAAIINTCIANAVTNSQPSVRLPAGSILIKASAINATNRGGLRIFGASGAGNLSGAGNPAGQTTLFCQTGTVCIDTTGSPNIEIADLVLVIGNPAVTLTPIGILQGRDASFCFVENYKIHNVGIYDYANNTTVNGGRGAIAIYNVNAENGLYENNVFNAGTPMVFTKTNIATISSPYQTIQTGCPASMTTVQMNNNVTAPAASTLANIEADGTLGFDVTNPEAFGGQETILFEGAAANRWHVTGNHEANGTAPKYFIQTSIGVRDSVFSPESAASIAFINVTANSQGFINDIFDFNTDGAAPFITNTATGTTITGGYVSYWTAATQTNTTISGATVVAPNISTASLASQFSTASSFPFTASDGAGYIGTPKGTGIATQTLKKGSGAGNYTNGTTSYTVADATNLCFTVTIPTGWKLGISASGGLATATGAVVAQAALTDNAACSTANSGILLETPPIQGAGIGIADAFALNWVITGDGNAHNIALQFKTSNVADTASLINSSATITPTMSFSLMPSN